MTLARGESSPTHRGIAFAWAAAVTFGCSSPLVKRHLADVPALTLSGLLYLGAGMAMVVVRGLQAGPAEGRLRGRDFLWLAAGIACGGVIAPLLLVLGIVRTTATATSLLLNAELVLTVVIAAIVFHEHVGRRVAAAAVLIALGAASLSFEPGRSDSQAPALGAAFVLLACLAWGVENNLTQRISHRDPFAIVKWKGLVAGSASLGLAAATGQFEPPGASLVLLALAIGAVSYGGSIVLYTYAQRTLGSARTAAHYGVAPFIGAALAVALGEGITWRTAAAAGTMAMAAWLLLTERHSHRHVHEEMEHEHRHVHDEHHRHEHDGTEGPEPHSHRHRHEALEHEHPHTPDVHHRHTH
jgi:drug/metabolite transporter (DMT)-like permease